MYPSSELKDDSAQDIFATLPTELVWHVADLLPAKDVSRCVAVSRSVRSACDGTYWRHRFDSDMPFLYDLKMAVGSEEHVDWHAIYKMLHGHAFPLWLQPESYEAWEKHDLPKALEEVKKRADDPGMTAIASRRRVWQCCEQLLNYSEEPEEETTSPGLDS